MLKSRPRPVNVEFPCDAATGQRKLHIESARIPTRFLRRGTIMCSNLDGGNRTTAAASPELLPLVMCENKTYFYTTYLITQLSKCQNRTPDQ